MHTTKVLPAHFKVLDASQGIIEAIVSVFSNVDRVNERVMPGAFTKSIEAELPKVLFSHDPTRPIGITLEAKELMPGDPLLPAAIKQFGGLYVKGQINTNVQDGKDTISHLEFGSLNKFSIGYDTDKSSGSGRTPDSPKDLLELTLYEWSPVAIPANNATGLISMKEKTAMQAKELKYFKRGKAAKGASKAVEIATKGEFLGDDVEQDAAIGAIYALVQSAMMDVVYPNVYNETLSPEQVAEVINGAFCEVGELASDVLLALLTEADDPMGEQALGKALAKFFPRERAEDIELPMNGKFVDNLKSLVDGVAKFNTLAKTRVETRIKSGRKLSKDTVNNLQEVHDGIKDMMNSCKDHMKALKEMIDSATDTTSETEETDGDEKRLTPQVKNTLNPQEEYARLFGSGTAN